MNIGDKVRNIKGNEEGIVTKFLKDNLVEVEIEDGFNIPFLMGELTVVAAAENKYFKKEFSDEKATDEIIPRSIAGVFLSFIPITEGTYMVQLSNNTEWQMPFTLYVGEDSQTRGLMGGVLEPKGFLKAGTTLKAAAFDDWSDISIQALHFKTGTGTQPTALLRKFRLRANSLFKELKNVPLSAQKGYVVQLDVKSDFTEETQPITSEPNETLQKLQDKFKEGENTERVANQPAKKKSGASVTVDLHIEKLTNQFLTMSSGEMVVMQLSHFEKQLEQAIAVGADEITFIHGVGSGKLRQEVHRQLSQHPNVAWYKDAQKEKFGYGATLAGLK